MGIGSRIVISRPYQALVFLFPFISHLLVLVYSFAPAQGPKRVHRELMLQYSDNQTISHFPRWCCIQQYHMYTPNLGLRIAVLIGKGRGTALEGVLNKRKGASRGLGGSLGEHNMSSAGAQQQQPETAPSTSALIITRYIQLRLLPTFDIGISYQKMQLHFR